MTETEIKKIERKIDKRELSIIALIGVIITEFFVSWIACGIISEIKLNNYKYERMKATTSKKAIEYLKNKDKEDYVVESYKTGMYKYRMAEPDFVLVLSQIKNIKVKKYVWGGVINAYTLEEDYKIKGEQIKKESE